MDVHIHVLPDTAVGLNAPGVCALPWVYIGACSVGSNRIVYPLMEGTKVYPLMGGGYSVSSDGGVA